MSVYQKTKSHLKRCCPYVEVQIFTEEHLRATDQKYRESNDRTEISYFSFFPQNVVNYFQNHIYKFRRFFVFLKIAKVEKLAKSSLGIRGKHGEIMHL